MLVHAATSDLATFMMVLDQLDGKDGFAVESLTMPAWTIADGRPAFAERFAVNAYLVLSIATKDAAAAWQEEWADYLRTDLKKPFADEEYEWIEARAAK